MYQKHTRDPNRVKIKKYLSISRELPKVQEIRKSFSLGNPQLKLLCNHFMGFSRILLENDKKDLIWKLKNNRFNQFLDPKFLTKIFERWIKIITNFCPILRFFQKCSHVRSLWAAQTEPVSSRSTTQNTEKIGNSTTKNSKMGPDISVMQSFRWIFFRIFSWNWCKKFDVKTHEQFIRSKSHLHLVRNWDYPQIERISTRSHPVLACRDYLKYVPTCTRCESVSCELVAGTQFSRTQVVLIEQMSFDKMFGR